MVLPAAGTSSACVLEQRMWDAVLDTDVVEATRVMRQAEREGCATKIVHSVRNGEMLVEMLVNAVADSADEEVDLTLYLLDLVTAQPINWYSRKTRQPQSLLHVLKMGITQTSGSARTSIARAAIVALYNKVHAEAIARPPIDVMVNQALLRESVPDASSSVAPRVRV